MSTQTAPPMATPPVAGEPSTGESASERRRPSGIEHLAVVPVLILAAVLNTYRLSQNGFGNLFYSAGVKSMLLSLHNFFFVSFDGGGLVMMDKPPVGLWLQAASAKVFGFTPLALLLPEAIGGVIAVGVLYGIVARRFGVAGGVLAGIALAVFPSFVAVSRDNNIDTILILLMVLACGAALRATEQGRLRWLVVSAVMVGLAFNTKTLAAYLIVPGIGLAYLICAPGSWRRRIVQLLVAGAVMIVVSGAWIFAVDNTPASQRPYVGGSTNNTEWNLTTQYNGVGRVGGQVGGPGRVPRAEQLQQVAAQQAVASHTKPTRRTSGRHLVTFGGNTGALRLFDIELGDQGGWLLPFAFVGMLAIALLTIPRRRDPRLAVLIVFGAWFLAEFVVLSFGQGIIHPYYVSALGPGTAVMVGAGAIAMAELARRGGWRRIIPAIAVGGAVAGELVMLQRESFITWWVPVLIAAAAASVLLMLFLRRGLLAAMALGVGALLVAPAAIAETTWTFRVEGTFPAAGPTAGAGYGGLGQPRSSLRFNEELLAWINTHHPGTRWTVLTDASSVAAPLILLGSNAGALGGYSGGDPAADGLSLSRLVASGEARFMLMGGVYWDRGGNAATRAIVAVCRPVPPAIWHAGATASLTITGARVAPPVRISRVVPPPTPNSFTLYDCRGRAPELATWRPAVVSPPARAARAHAVRAVRGSAQR